MINESALSVVVLTAIPAEHAAMLSKLQDVSIPGFVDQTLYTSGIISTPAGHKITVRVATLGAGNIDVAAEAGRAVARMKPDVLLFVGIAGALKDLEISDVVMGSEIVWGERAKLEGGRRLQRPRVESCSRELVQVGLYTVSRHNWRRHLDKSRYGEQKRDRPWPRAFVGQILSGEELVKDTGSKNALKRTFSDALAVENEGYGVARAASSSCHVGVVRAASDSADESKTDKDQDAAADAAASFATELLSDFVDLRSRSTPDQEYASGHVEQASVPTTSTTSELLVETLVTDEDLVTDDIREIQALAEGDYARLEPTEVREVLDLLCAEVDDSNQTFIASRLRTYGRALASLVIGTRDGSIDLDQLLKRHSPGAAIVFAQPLLFVDFEERVRRRILSGLLGSPTAPRTPTAIGWSYLLELGKVASEAENSRISNAILSSEYSSLIAARIPLRHLAPKINEDLRSGRFEQQNSAARVLVRLSEADTDLTLSEADDIELGISMITAATGGSFGAQEATTYNQISGWPVPRIAGGIVGSLTRGDAWLRTPGDEFGRLLSATVATDSVEEVLGLASRELRVALKEPASPAAILDLREVLESYTERLPLEKASLWTGFCEGVADIASEAGDS